MAFWDDIKDKITSTGKQAVNKTKELTETAKIKLNISEEEKKVSASYEKIGRAYAAAHTDGERVLPEEFSAIEEANARIASYKERLRELKGITVCPACGSEISEDVKFCPKCGAAAEANTEKSEDESEQRTPNVCLKCGAALKPDQDYCSECGEKVEK